MVYPISARASFHPSANRESFIICYRSLMRFLWFVGKHPRVFIILDIRKERFQANWIKKAFTGYSRRLECLKRTEKFMLRNPWTIKVQSWSISTCERLVYWSWKRNRRLRIKISLLNFSFAKEFRFYAAKSYCSIFLHEKCSLFMCLCNLMHRASRSRPKLVQPKFSAELSGFHFKQEIWFVQQLSSQAAAFFEL